MINCCYQREYVVGYNPDVEIWREQQRKNKAEEPKVPTIQVNLVDTVEIPPQQQTIVQVRAQPLLDDGPLYVEQTALLSSNSEMPPKDVLLQPNKAGFASMVISNPTAMPQVLAKEACVGEATPVSLVDVIDPSDDSKGEDGVGPADHV